MEDKVFEKLKEIAANSPKITKRKISNEGNHYFFGNVFMYWDKYKTLNKSVGKIGRFVKLPIEGIQAANLHEIILKRESELEMQVTEKEIQEEKTELQKAYEEILSYGESAPQWPKSEIIPDSPDVTIPKSGKAALALTLAALLCGALGGAFSILALFALGVFLFGMAVAYTFPITDNAEGE